MKDIPYELMPRCQNTFDLLKKYVIESPILKYPNPKKPYTLYGHIIEGKREQSYTPPHMCVVLF